MPHAASPDPRSPSADNLAEDPPASLDPPPERWLTALGLPTAPAPDGSWDVVADIPPDTLSGALEEMLTGPAPLDRN